MDLHVADRELLARFIFFESYFDTKKQRIKHNAFMPDQDLETSVSRIDALDEQQVWMIGVDVASESGRRLCARGDLSTEIVRKHRLNVVSQEPPPRHANIVGWPTEKSEQKLLAKELAASASLVVKPQIPLTDS